MIIRHSGRMAHEAVVDKSVLNNGERIYVVRCMQTDIAGQGATIAARANLHEAIALWFEAASTSEVENRLQTIRGR